MNRIKVIDLLNMISKGEEVPKKIKFNGFVWTYDIYNKRYYEGENLLFNVLGHYKGIILNDEVEIIEEEKKIPEKLNLKLEDWTTPTQCDIELSKKIDEIIDYLKSKGDNK